MQLILLYAISFIFFGLAAILRVFCGSAGKITFTGPVLFGPKIQVIGLRRVEGGVNGCFTRRGDRPRRQPGF